MNRHRYIVRAGRHVSKVPILLQKSFWGDERNFLEPLIRFTSGDVRGPYHLIQNRPGTSIVALKSDTAPEKSKDQLSRDFSGRSIFDFFNNICQRRTWWSGETKGVAKYNLFVVSDDACVASHLGSYAYFRNRCLVFAGARVH